MNLSTFKRVFGKHCEIVAASSGAEALDLLATDEFDAVLTDFGMPGMNGAQLVRSAKQLPPVAFVMVTGYVDGDEVVALQAAGDLYGVVAKPWDRASILDAIAGATLHTQSLRAEARKTES